MTHAEFLDRIELLYATRGGAEYHGEVVTELEHALQAATLAEQAGKPASWVSAALLHDIGHLLHGLGEDAAKSGIDDRHEELGVRFLARAFGPEVTEPVRLHVAAKRYLCAVEPEYLGRLSPASIRSLELQGGAMTSSEARDFEGNPHFAAIVGVRRYDDMAKVPGAKMPPLSHFRKYLEECRGFSTRICPELEANPSTSG